MNKKLLKTLTDDDMLSTSMSQPIIIAEIGVNHEGCINTARHLINQAKEGGADAVKFQAYKADLIASKQSPAYWDTTKEKTLTQYELFKKYDKFGYEELALLAEYCKETEIEFLCTPFDVMSSNYLNELQDVYKISSSDITNKPLIDHIASFKKPILLSTGASTLTEICEAVGWIESSCRLALLHCILNYPTDDSDANLDGITTLKRHFPDFLIGYSDHTMPKDMQVCELAFVLGAKIIEKHFTHDKKLPGNDHYHAMDIDDLKHLRSRIEKTLDIIGECNLTERRNEALSRKNARRSLVAAKKVRKGYQICFDDLIAKRPGTGISPNKIDEVVGKVASIDIEADAIINEKMYE